MPWLAAKSGRAAIFGLLSESNEAQNCRANCAQLCRMLIALGEFCLQGREWWQGREWLQVGSVGSFDMLFFLQVTARLRTCIKVYVWVWVCVCVRGLSDDSESSQYVYVYPVTLPKAISQIWNTGSRSSWLRRWERKKEKGRRSARQMNGLRRHSCYELPQCVCVCAGVYCTGHEDETATQFEQKQLWQ